MAMFDGLDAFILLARVMNGESKAVENMERSGHERAIRIGLMPKDMFPSQDNWEKLGFIFSEIDDDLMYSATLPYGWTMRMTDHDMYSEIIDSNGLIRGEMFYKASLYDRRADMVLVPRYKVTSFDTDCGDHYIRTIYFGNKDEILFIAGEVCSSYDADYEEYKIMQSQENELIEVATQFARDNYPDYDDIFAYWDKQKTLIKK